MRVVRRTVVRAYADTSVYGGVFDPGFETASRAFFERVQNGEIQLVVSALVRQELADAPPDVHDFAFGLLRSAEEAPTGPDVIDLHAAYLAAEILGPRRAADLMHVALASVADCTMVVSWNFKHIVHYEKIPQYNAINVVNGYHQIAIYSPLEVGRHADDDT